MERKICSVDTKILLEEYRTLLETVEMLPLQITGNSMAPFLVHGRDTVYLTKIDRPLRVGDIVLYRRRNGAYILHRICGMADGSYSFVGDAQKVIEHGIKREQIFAVVCAAECKGKWQEPGCFRWDFFSKVWLRVVPMRSMFMSAYYAVRKWFRRKI